MGQLCWPFIASFARSRIPPGVPRFPRSYAIRRSRFLREGPYRAVWARRNLQRTGPILLTERVRIDAASGGLSPLLGALYLTPLDRRMETLCKRKRLVH